MSLWVALVLAGCASDADCVVSTWKCCGCPEQRALTKAELKRQEDDCAIKKCDNDQSGCGALKAVKDAAAVCRAGACALSTAKPSGAECAAAADCEVFCCQEDYAAAPKGKSPRKGCKRCPAPRPAAECLEGKCSVAPRALDK